MKTLQTIQKTCKVFQTLTKIAMILCFVGSGLLLLGLVCGIVISSAGAVVSGGVETLYKLTASASFYGWGRRSCPRRAYRSRRARPRDRRSPSCA